MDTAHQERTDDPEPLEPWLRGLRFRFDPFQHLEASADPNLGDYIVGHKTFALAWDDAPALIFAPAGGGKTAMRLYTTRSCWVGLGGSHPFPIPYILSNHPTGDQPPTPAEHLREIVRAASSALLIGLAFRPERLLALDRPSRGALAALLHAALPSPLPRYLAILRDTATPLALPPLLERTYVLPNLPDRPTLLKLCDAFEDALSAAPAAPPSEAWFEHLVALLIGPLGFRSIFVLVDGVDAFPQTMRSQATAAAWLAWPLAQTADWAARRIFLKGFLPSETEAAVAECVPELMPAIGRARLDWTVARLADMLRRRVYVASDGEFGSLDAVCGPALRDVETTLVKALPARARLPREALLLVGAVLRAYARRAGSVAGQLHPEDIQAGIAAYQKQSIHLGAASPAHDRAGADV